MSATKGTCIVCGLGVGVAAGSELACGPVHDSDCLSSHLAECEECRDSLYAPGEYEWNHATERQRQQIADYVKYAGNSAGFLVYPVMFGCAIRPAQPPTTDLDTVLFTSVDLGNPGLAPDAIKWGLVSLGAKLYE